MFCDKSTASYIHTVIVVRFHVGIACADLTTHFVRDVIDMSLTLTCVYSDTMITEDMYILTDGGFLLSSSCRSKHGSITCSPLG